MGFFAKNVDGRIDDPNTGWKGKELWSTYGQRTMFHLEGGKENNVPDAFIANIDSADDGYFLKLTAQPDGTFTVYNARNKNEKTYTK